MLKTVAVISWSSIFITLCFQNLLHPHAGKIAFYLGSLFESEFICVAFARDLRTGVIGDIDILGAAIAFPGTEKFMIDGTFTRQTLFFLF